MSKKIDELLAVLDMPKVEQFEWLLEHKIVDDSLVRSQVTNEVVPHWIDIEFAFRAFRLRDEVSAQGWDFQKLLNRVRIGSKAGYDDDNGVFWICHIAQPIHWIIAALIAKEIEDGNRNSLCR